jgi:acetoin utilization deacetylase AcuC-like enzyme
MGTLNPFNSRRLICLKLFWIFTSLALFGSTAPLAIAQPKQEIWYHTGYPGEVAGPRAGMSALTGPTKMPAVFEAIWRNRLIEPGRIHTDSLSVMGRAPFASPIDLESLRVIHTDRYLKALFTGEPRSLATSQGLPTWNEDIARGWLLNVGGLHAAGESALRKKTITANLGHGYHHATVNRGMGFCTINGLVVVAKKLIREAKAKRVMIIDLDHHEGNGTAECMIGDSTIWNVSLYGSYMGGPPSSGNNHVFHIHHEAFEKGDERDTHYLAVISEMLPPLIRLQNPDLILYQAGMDPFDCGGISREALAIRDAYVFALSRSMDKPVTWVLAGGYADIDTLVELHTGTVRMANEVLNKVKPGDTIENRGMNPFVWIPRNGAIHFPAWGSFIKKPLQVNKPPPMSNDQAEGFVSLREQLLKEEALPKDEITSTYRKLFAFRPSP